MKIRPYLPSFLKKLKRGPAVTSSKEAGIIISYSEIDKNSKVVEIGTGSGFLTIQLARVAKKVTTYEKREDHARIAKSNFEKLKIKNIVSKVKEINGKIPEKNLDLLMIDIPNAQDLVESLHSNVKEGGFLVGHCLSVEQAKSLFLECQKYFKDVFMVEPTIREYDVNERRVRPKHLGITFTSFLVFAKK